jgi:hypothetical protein
MAGHPELIRFKRIYEQAIHDIQGAEILSEYGPEFISQFAPFFVVDLPSALENISPDFLNTMIRMFERRSAMLHVAERNELKELVKPLIEFILNKDAEGALLQNIGAYVRILRSYDFLAGRWQGPLPPPASFQLRAQPPPLRPFPQINLWAAAQPLPVVAAEAAAAPPPPIAQGTVGDLFPSANHYHGILRRLHKLDLLPEGSTGKRNMNAYEEQVGPRVRRGGRRSRRGRRRSKARRTRRR